MQEGQPSGTSWPNTPDEWYAALRPELQISQRSHNGPSMSLESQSVENAYPLADPMAQNHYLYNVETPHEPTADESNRGQEQNHNAELSGTYPSQKSYGSKSIEEPFGPNTNSYATNAMLEWMSFASAAPSFEDLDHDYHWGEIDDIQKSKSDLDLPISEQYDAASCSQSYSTDEPAYLTSSATIEFHGANTDADTMMQHSTKSGVTKRGPSRGRRARTKEETLQKNNKYREKKRNQRQTLEDSIASRQSVLQSMTSNGVLAGQQLSSDQLWALGPTKDHPDLVQLWQDRPSRTNEMRSGQQTELGKKFHADYVRHCRRYDKRLDECLEEQDTILKQMIASFTSNGATERAAASQAQAVNYWAPL
ncbi:uncharacterized protein I303_107996 [Kwoniella dejecticola CBS 10117]|uniref:Uncharacterized protein n=1 Tax=Kwoniella dejecticola CBS 10117 TaxID=1296121 RepID=A0A1A5ZW88_9TREE|nr:uncharacterized protein I303_07987 [Kwoniella dejecticola CBS 10117]OBR82073.1 hypothetical protein I303_07987 [Kwoniella dejecticola CBS 10117]